MDWLLILVPLSLVVALGIGVVFGWAAKQGQFEDLESHGRKLLSDDDRAPALPAHPLDSHQTENVAVRQDAGNTGTPERGALVPASTNGKPG